MGLACAQVTLLTLTSRKADIEYREGYLAAQKQTLLREQTALSREYYNKLQNKQVSYYANNKYNTINYNYIMGGTLGTGGTFNISQMIDNEQTIKTNNSMILTDYKGNVFLSSAYAKIFASVMGLSDTTKGGVCNPSNNQYAEMLAQITQNTYTKDEFLKVINGEELESEVNKADGGTWPNTTDETGDAESLVYFYLPILKAAAANGWTTEYEQYAQSNPDYISDALMSGTLQLATVNTNGNYTTQESLNYFITAGYVQTNSSSDTREAITAWYEEEKSIISEKENIMDTELSNLSAELEAIKTEMDSIKSIIDDAISKFNWNNG